MEIAELLSTTITRHASDLHLVSGFLPTLRIEGNLKPLVTIEEISASEIERMIYSLLTSSQKEILIANKELDFSTVFTLPSQQPVRFRVNAYYQKGQLSSSFRLIPSVIPSIEDLRLPPILHEIAKLRQGFVLITGPTSQGKSTTLASTIEEINKNRAAHIISVEDPIEYVFPKGKSIISQREMYQDTHSWNAALKHVLREDPDIVFIGEMRDFDTIASALTIAETGHLVFSTLHTNSTSQTVDRIIDIFPPNQQSQIRMQLSMVLSAIITQKLVPTISGERIPVCEVLLGTSPVKNTIREGKTHLLDNIIQTSSDTGMMLFEEHLKTRVEENIIAHDTALQYAIRPDTYLQLIQR